MKQGKEDQERKRQSSDAGQAVVEFALVLPLLLILLLGILEFGHLYSQVSILQGAAREGVREAVLGGTPAQVRDRVERAATGLDKQKIQVIIERDTAQRLITVEVTYPAESLTGFFPLQGLYLRATAAMAYDRGP